MKKEDRTKPRQVDMSTSGCKCDQCERDLSVLESIWIFDAFFACSKSCILKLENSVHFETEENETDLL